MPHLTILHADLDGVRILVLDEADRMLDMGSVPDLHRIISTLPEDHPSMVAVMPPASVSHMITQQVIFVEQTDKRQLLKEILSRDTTGRAIVFARTKHRANKVAKQLLTDSDQPFHSAAIASLHVGTSSRRAGVSPPKAKRRFGRGRGAVSRPAYAGARR